MDWINLGQHRDKRQAVADTVMTEFRKQQEISLLDEELAAFEDGICPMGLSVWVYSLVCDQLALFNEMNMGVMDQICK